MVHEVRVERTKRKAWTVQEHYYIFQVIFWGQMLSLALSSSSFLHNHALCQLQAVLLAINTTFVVFVGCLHVSVSHVQCQGLSLIYLGSVTVILCVFVIALFLFYLAVYISESDIPHLGVQVQYQAIPPPVRSLFHAHVRVHSAQCTTLLINFLCAMCK